MAFHVLANHTTTPAAAQTLAQMALVNDTIITQQNAGFIFTADYLLGIAYGLGKTMTELRINQPALNAFMRHNIWPFESTGVQPPTVPDLTQIADYLPAGIKLAKNEPLFLEFSTSGALAEDDYGLLFLFTPDHKWALPPNFQQRLVAKATPASITAVANAWTGPSALTFEQNLRGGWYCVMGVNVEAALGICVRLLFPRAPLYNDRILRPGTLCQNSYSLRPNPRFMGRLGQWGCFHSFEPPQVEILSNTAGAIVPDMRLDLCYLGDSAPDIYPQT